MPKQLHSDFYKDKVNTLLDLMRKASARGADEQWARYAAVMASLEGAYQTALLREMLEKRDGLLPPVRE